MEESHIDCVELDALIEQFMHENTFGTARQLAEFMYNKGWEAGMTSTCEMF